MKEIIYKGNEISKTKCKTNRTRSANIIIDQFKWFICPLIESIQWYLPI